MSAYTLKNSKYIRDIKCEAKLYEHNKTGARVVIMPADDTNRAITVAFSTPAENDKGIPHIIEHSVLCGSEKYPLKDPFVQLMKGSMYSFLNAMTGSTYTVYPVASTNEKDFKNLADVYLDACFNPNMPHKKEVFLQEGKHYVIDENGEVTGFNGVVYNEMRGVEGSADFHIDFAAMKALFDDSPYQYESGGLPLAIGDLTYEELCDFYKRHYTASNCVIFLYGKNDYGEMLDYIDREYLSKYEKTEYYSVSEINSPCKSEVTAPYPADEDGKDKAYYFSYAAAVDIDHSPLNMLTLRVLERILCSSQGAYIKNAMQKAGIGEDFYSVCDDSAKIPYFSFISAKCYENDKEKFREVIENTLKGLVENGIDKERLFSSLRRLEFQEKEAADTWTPKGITYALQMLPSFLFGESDPLSALEIFDGIDELKELAKGDYFERFIEEHFLNNTRKTLVTLVPDPEFASREDRLLNEKCAENSKAYSIDELKADYELLNSYRGSEDTAEAIDTIPILERSDLTLKPEIIESEEVKAENASIIFQKRDTNQIAYFDYLFDLRAVDKKLLPYYRIFAELAGAMNTSKHGYSELSDLIDSYTGDISLSLKVIDSTAAGGEVTPYLVWHSACLYENGEKVKELNREIFNDTDFSDTARIYDLLLQYKTGAERDFLEASHIAARELGLAAFSKKYAWMDYLNGYSFYKFLTQLLNGFDSKKDEIVAALNSFREAMRNKNAWKFAYVGGSDYLDSAKSITDDFAAMLNKNDSTELTDIPLGEKKSAAYLTPSQVQYASLCGIMPEKAREIRGIVRVAEHLINTDYLWHNIRVLGGAYGCFATFSYEGEGCMVSYRDPKLDSTLDCYKKAADYLENLNIDERTVRQFVIGALNKLDKPLMAYHLATIQINNELAGVTTERQYKTREQIINATLSDIKAFSPLLREWINSSLPAVIGSEQAVKNSDYKFDEVKNMI